MTPSERTLEVLLDLERARQREHQLRIESEALLEGLRAITFSNSTETLFSGLVEVLHQLFEFDEAFILQLRDDGRLHPVISTAGEVMECVWRPRAMLKRVLGGKPSAVFDVNQVPEWKETGLATRLPIKSALHIHLHTGHHPAILVCAHHNARYFGPRHIKLIGRFSPLIAQALMTLDLKQAVTERDRFFELSLDLMGISGYDGCFKQVNEAWCHTLGYDMKSLKSRPFIDLIHPQDRPVMEGALRQVAHSNSRQLVEVQFRCHDDVYRWLSCSLAIYPEEQLYYISARDVTDRVNAQQRLIHETHHDSLTGLLNRNGFLKRLDEAITRVQDHPGYHFAILFLDLDRFKIINDSLGHLAGDELLVEIAARLRAATRAEDIVGRLGGDEFIVLVPEIRDTADAIHVAEHLLNRLKKSIKIFGQEVFTTASIGITVSSNVYTCAEEVLRDADTAMYFAKAQGKARYAAFDRSMHEQAVAQLQMENDLRRALENDEFELYYQPIVSLSSGAITGFESLIRWHHPLKGMVSPLDFIPIAEETGLIIPLGEWISRQACRQLKNWQRRFPSLSDLTMNINISAQQFWQQDFVTRLRDLLETESLDPACIGLEITESVIMHNADNAAALFRQLKDTGVNVYIDDFGTGYSSLSYLHRFQFDGIKIDRSFVHSMEKEKTNLELVGTIMLLANNLQLRVVAEGVETESQARLLSQLNCEWVQGFLSSRPLPAEAAEALLVEQVFRQHRLLDCG